MTNAPLQKMITKEGNNLSLLLIRKVKQRMYSGPWRNYCTDYDVVTSFNLVLKVTLNKRNDFFPS
jgi:hypothetical protein